MNETLQTIMNRRSVRKYKSDLIPKELLDQVIEAGIYGPSGGNNHTAHIYIIQEDNILVELKKKVRNEFKKMSYDENTYRSLRNSIIASKNGDYDFTYNAPCLVIITDQKDYGNAMADSVCILENMMIAATSLGLGTCYINQLHWLDGKPSIMKYLHIPEEETITCSLVIGYPDMEIIPRNKPNNPITYITNESLTLAKFIDQDGIIIQWPSLKQEEARNLILAYAASQFKKNQEYTEKQINEILKHYYPTDYVLLRRELVEAHYLSRTYNGAIYTLEDK